MYLRTAQKNMKNEVSTKNVIFRNERYRVGLGFLVGAQSGENRPPLRGGKIPISGPGRLRQRLRAALGDTAESLVLL